MAGACEEYFFIFATCELLKVHNNAVINDIQTITTMSRFQLLLVCLSFILYVQIVVIFVLTVVIRVGCILLLVYIFGESILRHSPYMFFLVIFVSNV